MIRLLFLQILTLAILFWIPTTHAQSVGQIDRSFGQRGKQIINFNIEKSKESQQAMRMQADGKILLTGYISSEFKEGFNIYRMLNDGQIDTTFGNRGQVHIPIEGQASAMSLQADGKILLAGYTQRGKFRDMTVIRLLSDGQIDQDFGIKGKANISFSGVVRVAAVEALDNGEIIIAGDTYEKSWIQRKFAIACLKTSGQPDGHFGKNGKMTIEAGKYARCEDIAIQHDGKILAAGYAKVNEFHDFVLLRLHSDGRADHSFGTAGIQRIHIGTENDYAKRIKILPSHKILLAGHAKTTYSGNFDFTVMRLHLDGSLDQGFGKAGIRTINAEGMDYVSDLVIQPDGNLLIGGTSNYKYTVLRLNHRGNIDRSFGKEGIQQMKKVGGRSNDYTSDMILQEDGRILLAGVCSFDYTLIRLQGNPYLHKLDELLAFEYEKEEVVARNYAQLQIAPGFQIKAWLKQDGGEAILEGGSGTQSLMGGVDAYVKKIITNHGHFKLGDHYQLVIVRDANEDIHYYVNHKYAHTISAKPVSKVAEK